MNKTPGNTIIFTAARQPDGKWNIKYRPPGGAEVVKLGAIKNIEAFCRAVSSGGHSIGKEK